MTFIPNVFYQQPKAALAWLERAFGFETTLLVESQGGNESQIHAEMSFDGGTVNIGGEWSDWTRSPRLLGGKATQAIEVAWDGDIDGHCEQARAAGATILQEPADQFYGARTYRAVDPEGHVWTFAHFTGGISNEEMEAASGLKISTLLNR